MPYAWGWKGNPWYGYYGAYFSPYPVYPSAAFWIADYLIAASLANAYAAAAVTDSGQLQMPKPDLTPHLICASYDPATGTTSPTMTKEVKDAVAQEISQELAAQQVQGDDKTPADLATLLGDGKPHVFVAAGGVNVPAGGAARDGAGCGLTEGDVLALNAAPPQDADHADLRVLASKQTDCAKGSVVSVQITVLQEMQKHLLANIDSGMAEMKDHPGKGLPTPPAADTQGTKAAPYAAAAPAADPNGAAQLDAEAQNGAQLEQQVVAEAKASDTTAGPNTALGGTIPGPAAGTAATPAPAGPVTIALGQTPAQVIASNGQPSSKVELPNKVISVYPEMKIIFVGGKVSDVQ